MKSEFKYGTPEYKIAEAQAKMQECLDEVLELRRETGQIQPVKKITVGGRTKHLSCYFNSRHYSSFDSGLTKDVELAWKNFCEEHKKLNEEANTLHAANAEAIESNIKLRDKIKAFMKSVGVGESYSVYELPTPRHRNKKHVSKTAGFLQDLQRCVPVDDLYNINIRQLKDAYRTKEEQYKKYLVAIAKNKKEKEKEDAQVKKVAQALVLAEKEGLGEFATNDLLIDAVNEHEQAKWIEENYPDGVEVDIKCCSECNSWTVGEHRCFCGNRRMYLSVDGDFFKGFMAYPMAD